MERFIGGGRIPRLPFITLGYVIGVQLAGAGSPRSAGANAALVG